MKSFRTKNLTSGISVSLFFEEVKNIINLLFILVTIRNDSVDVEDIGNIFYIDRLLNELLLLF